MKRYIAAVFVLLLLAPFSASGWQKGRARLEKIEQSLKDHVPNLMCVNQSFATGGQPSMEAFGKLANNGYRSVLNLRTANEGVDLDAERKAVEQAGLRYINIPVAGSAPKDEMADDFLKAVRNKSNHPMLIHCASANRVGAFWMIYRVIDQGWPEAKAYEEASKIGLKSPALKKFAEDYIAAHKK